MGNRLSKITTRTGDRGETGLGDGSRINKDDVRIDAIGDVDELNSWIGVLRTDLAEDDEYQVMLHQIQHDLFDLGGELAVPGYDALTDQHLLELEQYLADFNDQLPPLKEFILPGGSPCGAHCHMARTVCRRAERTLVKAARSTDVSELALRYINRLSDLLFVFARILARRRGGQEILWQSRRQSRPSNKADES